MHPLARNIRRSTFSGIDVVDMRNAWPREGGADLPAPAAGAIGIAIHHDGIPANVSDLDGDLERVEAIHRYNLGQGWGSFPYHRIVSRAGRIFYVVDKDRAGSHIYHRNGVLKAVALMGDLTQQEPTDAQICGAAAAIVMTYQDIGHLAGIGPHKELVEPPHGDPWHSHATACPGDWNSWTPKLWPLVAYHMRRLLDIQLDR